MLQLMSFWYACATRTIGKTQYTGHIDHNFKGLHFKMSNLQWPKMRKKATPPSSLKLLFAAAVLSFYSVTAFTQNLNVASDQVTVSSGGFGPSALTINNTTGIVTSVTLPVASVSGGTATPNFSFTMASSGVSDGTYTFKAGFVIDDDNSARRLEISIPSISMVFSASGATLAGSVPAGSSVNVRGRASDNTTQVSASLSNALFSFSGSTLSFDSGNQVTEIQGKGGILGDIATTISANGAYSYKVVLKQLSGPATLNFGTISGAFNALGCAPANAFELGSNASSFSGGFGVQGQFKIVAGAFGAAPTAFSSTCTTEIASGGGGGTTPAATTDASITAAADDLTAATTPAAVEAAVDSANELATDLATQIASGDATVENGVSLLETLNTGLGVIGTSTASGETIDPVKVTNTLNSISSVITAAAGQDPTPEQVTALQSVVVTTLSNLINATPTGADTEQADALIAQVSGLLAQVSSLPGSTVTASLATGARAISLDTIQKSSSSLNSKFNTGFSAQSTAAQMRLALESSSVKSSKRRIVHRSLRQKAPRMRGRKTRFTVPQATTASLATPATSSATIQAITSAPDLGYDPATITVETSSGSISAQDTVLNALGVDGATATFNGTNSTVLISANGIQVPVYVTQAYIHDAELFADGVSADPSGSLVLTSAGISVDAVPASRDPVSFLTALENASLAIDLTSSGIITLTAQTGERLSASFGFENVAIGTLGASPVTFTLPSGDPASADYVIGVNYSDGTTQKLQPALNAADMLDSAAVLGAFLSTDLSTGILSDGNGTRLRPDYYVNSVTNADANFWGANKDSFGIAYLRDTDFNSDGILDIEVITSDGKQVLYVLP